MNKKNQNVKQNTTIMIQARVGSKRLPRKVLAQIGNKPLIWYIINRVKRVKKINKIILLTSKSEDDEELLKIARKNKIIGFAGDEEDVLDRFYQCALHHNSNPIIRITGDCPLIDSKIIDKMLNFFLKNNYDYITNAHPPTFPDGLDVEIFSLDTIKKTHKLAKLRSDREHVTTFIKKNSDKFKVYNYKNKTDLSNLRFTVDVSQDLKLIRRIYAKMSPKKYFGLRDILRIIKNNPSILEINHNIRRNEGYFLSLEKDKG